MLIKKSNIAVILVLSILSIVYLNCGGGESTTDSVKAGAGADKSVTERQGSGTGENETAALMTVVDGVKQWDERPKNIAGGMLIAYKDEYRATVEMETVGGDPADGKSFKFDMWYSHSPIFHNSALSFTVNNFVFLARQGFYDGLTFHKVIAGEMALTGDPPGPLTGAGYTTATFNVDGNITQTIGVGSTAVGRVVSYDQTTGVLKYWQDKSLVGFNSDGSLKTDPTYGFALHRFTSTPDSGGNLNIASNQGTLGIDTSFGKSGIPAISSVINNRTY